MLSKPNAALDCSSESAYLTDQSAKTIKTGNRKKQSSTEFIYEAEILNHLLSIEDKHRYMVFKNPSLYDYMIRLLIQTSKKLKLKYQTLFLSKSIFDKVLSSFNCTESEALTMIPNKQILLILFSTLWIAIKYEEVKQPSLNQFVQLIHQQNWLSDYDQQMIRRSVNTYEAYILQAIKFDLNAPNVLTFVEFFVNKLKRSIKIAKYMMDLIYSLAEQSLFWSQQMVVTTPSIVAASIISIALELKDQKHATLSKKTKKEQKLNRNIQDQNVYQQLLNNSNKELIQFQECTKQIKKLLLFNRNEVKSRCSLSNLLNNRFNNE